MGLGPCMEASNRLLVVAGRIALSLMKACLRLGLPAGDSIQFLCIAEYEDLSLTCP